MPVLAGLPAGDSATFAAVAEIEKEIRRGAVEPDVIGVARRIQQSAPGQTPRAIAAGVLAWLTAVWRYADDPLGNEYVQTAAHSLGDWADTGYVFGDCDDLTVLGGALGRALGFPVRITVVSFADEPQAFSHVWASLLTPDGGAISLDVLKPTSGPVPPIARLRSFTVGGTYDSGISGGRAMNVSPRQYPPAAPSQWRGSQLGFVPLVAVQALPEVVKGAQSIIDNVNSLFGDSHKYGQPQFTGAEKSRADSYLLGIAGGSVLSGQYLLSQNRTDTSQYAQQYTGQLIAQAEAAYPDTMKQASAEGPVPDAADGSGGLRVLLNLGIPYSSQYAGYSTNTGNGPSGATLDLVNKVKALPAQGTAAAAAASAGKVLQAGFSNPWLILGIGGAVVYAIASSRGHRRGS